ncbi:MAG: UPF0175 family protein [Armatimonadetes bacterium]|nr:UPF0175 family protein [Armatimonadota bacterium]
MSAVIIEIPEDTLDALNLTPEQMAEEMRLSTAMRLYDQGRLSSGAAAALAGIPRVEFLSRLADYGIDAFRQAPGELAEELRNAREWSERRR